MTETQQIPITLVSGTTIAGYVLDELIGSGSSGDVWRAYFSEAPVAIKVMKADLLKGKRRDLHLRRFQAEVNALRLLALEARVPDLFDANFETSPPYFVMSIVTGQSFAEDIASGQMMVRPVKERLMRLHAIASTLDTVHETGLLHRDVKPANIRGWEQVYLLDFSIAMPIDAAQSADPNIGTRFYMPPYANLSPSIFTDNYGFALVCYEVLFGRHALFSLGEIGQDLQKIALTRLQQKTWYRPSQMSEAELPIYLRGADLLALDDIFQETFTNSNANSCAAMLVTVLEEAIIVPENEPYLERVPIITPLTENDALESEVFTDHEVDMQRLHTDLDANVMILSRKVILLIASSLGFIVLMAWLLLRNL